MKAIGTSERLVANIRTAPFRPFLVDGAPLPLQSVLQLDTALPAGVGFHVYRMEPGARSQPHEHTCDEHFLVLDGEVADNDGYVYRAGDLVLLKAGTQHCSHTETGCTLAVFVEKAEKNL